MSKATYYWLQVRSTEFADGNDFAPDFGDFDKEVVKQELEDRLGDWDEGLQRELKRKDMRVSTKEW